VKKIKICICGALGKMGKTLIKCITQNQKLKLESLNDLKSVKKGFHMRSSSSSSASNTSNINKSSLPPKYTLVKK
jgi:dihydrodipicolinate reductase